MGLCLYWAKGARSIRLLLLWSKPLGRARGKPVGIKNSKFLLSKYPQTLRSFVANGLIRPPKFKRANYSGPHQDTNRIYTAPLCFVLDLRPQKE